MTALFDRVRKNGRSVMRRRLESYLFASAILLTTAGCAGDGGGYYYIGDIQHHSYCDNISIYSGTVSATGGSESAGIGGSLSSGNCGNLYIYGGNVTAQGGISPIYDTSGGGAGIGAGEDAALGTLRITGGTLIAHGGSDSNAICSHKDSGTNDFTLRSGMRLRISDNILPYTAREWANIQTYKDIQIEPCPHSGNPCDWCMYGR